MLFILSKVFKRINKYLKKYLLIVVQVFLGILLIIVFLTINHSVNVKYEDLKSKAENELMKLNFFYQQHESTRDINISSQNLKLPPPFTYSNYEWIKNNYKNSLDVSLMQRKNLNLLVRNNATVNVCSIDLLYVTDSFFDMYLPEMNVKEINEKKCFIGQKAFQYLIDATVTEGDNMSMGIKLSSANELTISDNIKLEVIPIDINSSSGTNNLTLFTYSEAGKVKLEECIILPIRYFYLTEEPVTISNTYVNFKFRNSNFSSSEAIEIINYLYEQCTLYDYSFDTILDEFTRQTDTYKVYSIVLTILSVIILLIISVGLTGILLILVNRRTKEIAISLALGATRKQILIEIVFEAVFVTAFGGVIAILLSIFILNRMLEFRQFSIILDIKILLFAFAVSIIVGVFSSIVPMTKTRHISPMEILRSL